MQPLALIEKNLGHVFVLTALNLGMKALQIREVGDGEYLNPDSRGRIYIAGLGNLIAVLQGN